jgi:hypothetical protein
VLNSRAKVGGIVFDQICRESVSESLLSCRGG